MDAVLIQQVDPQSGPAVAAMTAYFAELDDRFPTGFDPGDTLTADAGGLRHPNGVFLVGVVGDRDGDGDGVPAVACGGVQVLADGAAEVKRMWVAPQWRGCGLGKRLLAELESYAAGLGNGIVRLDTNSVLSAAIAMYQTAGYQEIPPYNDNPFARHWFQKSLR